MLTLQKRRRERGRLAQSAFRKRQAEQKHGFQAQNAALKDAIAAIAAEATADDRPELKAAIRQAAQLAGFQDRKLCSRTCPPTDIDHRGASRTTEEAFHVDEASQQSRGSSGRIISSNWLMKSPRSVGQTVGLQSCDASMTDTGPIRCKECEAINTSVLQFIGVSSFNFASILFWHIFLKHEAMHHGQETLLEWQHRKLRLLKAAGVTVDSEGDVKVPLYPNLVLQAASLQDSEPEAWLSKVESRLDYCKRQSIRYYLSAQNGQHGDMAQPHPYQWVEPTASSENTHKWLSPTCAERRIRFIVGEEVFAAMAGPMIERWEQSKDIRMPKGSTEMIDRLLDSLSDTLACSGDGPQWDTEVFDATVMEWCLAVTRSQTDARNAATGFL